MQQPWSWDMVKLAHALRHRQISCTQVMQATFERLDACNPAINAVPEVFRDQAFAQARDADAMTADSQNLPPLHGVPVTVKMNIDQAGCVTANGVPAFMDRVAPHDAPVVAAARRAGAIIIGRTNVPPFSMRWDTDNEIHGRVVNPWDSHFSAGGSSGGSAAAVACGIGAASIGNDNGGSIRYPAYACGVVGLRPTPGRIAFYNATDRADRGISAQMMTVNGPLTRTVDDAALMLDVLSGPDVNDPLSLSRLSRVRPAPPQQTPVAMFSGDAAYQPDEQVRTALREAAERLKAAGYPVEEVAPPCFAEAADLWNVLTYDDRRRGAFDMLRQYGGEAVRQMVGFIEALPGERDRDGYLRALERRLTILREWSRFFARWPVLLMPVSWRQPLAPDEELRSCAHFHAILRSQSPLLVTSFLGIPSVAVPTSRGRGMPRGVQIAGWRFHEETCLAAARHVQAPVKLAQAAFA